MGFWEIVGAVVVALVIVSLLPWAVIGGWGLLLGLWEPFTEFVHDIYGEVQWKWRKWRQKR